MKASICFTPRIWLRFDTPLPRTRARKSSNSPIGWRPGLPRWNISMVRVVMRVSTCSRSNACGTERKPSTPQLGSLTGPSAPRPAVTASAMRRHQRRRVPAAAARRSGAAVRVFAVSPARVRARGNGSKCALAATAPYPLASLDAIAHPTGSAESRDVGWKVPIGSSDNRRRCLCLFPATWLLNLHALTPVASRARARARARPQYPHHRRADLLRCRRSRGQQGPPAQAPLWYAARRRRIAARGAATPSPPLPPRCLRHSPRCPDDRLGDTCSAVSGRRGNTHR